MFHAPARPPWSQVRTRPDPDTGNNSSTTSTQVFNQADLAVTKAGPASVISGNNITYTLTVANNGSIFDPNAVLTDTVPENTTFASETQTSGPAFGASTPAAGSTGTITYSIASLAAGASATFVIVVHVNNNAPSHGGIVNTAQASGSPFDPNTATNTATAFTTAITPTADLAVTGRVTPTTLKAGGSGPIVYTPTVTNNGPDAANNVQLIETIPVGVGSAGETHPTGWSRTGPGMNSADVLTFSIASLAAGASATLTIIVKAPACASSVRRGRGQADRGALGLLSGIRTWKLTHGGWRRCPSCEGLEKHSPPGSTPPGLGFGFRLASLLELGISLRWWPVHSRLVMLDRMSEVTRILSAIEQGDTLAAGELLPLVYDELRMLAAQQMAREAAGHTLQPTALVHEAYLRLVGDEDESHWENRRHFFGAAAEAMRRILIENARRKMRDKHGGDRRRVDLPDLPAADQEPEELLALDEALAKLTQEDPSAAAVVKLRLYTGLSVEEAAEALGLSRAHAYRHWTYARAWLRAALGESSAEI